jgi:hypothetical protein
VALWNLAQPPFQLPQGNIDGFGQMSGSIFVGGPDVEDRNEVILQAAQLMPASGLD